MSANLVAVILVIGVAMAFDYTNGFHDAANAIATSVSTRALTPRVALLVAAIGNFVGTRFGAKVAKTVGDGLVVLPPGRSSLAVVFAGVLGAIVWNLLTWYFGLPSSSTHALLGGLVGATLFSAGGTVQWANLLEKVVLPMLLSPLVGFILGGLLLLGLLWLIKGLTVFAQAPPPTSASSDEPPDQPPSQVPPSQQASPPTASLTSIDRTLLARIGLPGQWLQVAGESTRRATRTTVMAAKRLAQRIVQPIHLTRGFRGLQVVSATAMAIGHGMQDAAKTMGVIVLALYVGGFQDSRTHIPGWVYFTSATMLALGTYAGGWRIIRTLGRRIIHLGPMEGFAAETVASSVLYYNALVLGAPISTTHTITSAIMGVGATKRPLAVRWGVAGNIVTAWVLTFPGAGTIAVVVYVVAHFFF